MNTIKAIPPDKHVIDLLFELIDEVHEYFGYKEDWAVIPLQDSREFYWTLYEEANGGGHVRFAGDIETLKDEDSGHYFEDMIYTQRFLSKWVYRTEKHTMVSVDTRTDGNKFLRIFDNEKEIKPTGPYKPYQHKLKRT